ncbi:hypothetical protein GCM10009733_058890 [Nonomuraea maheshkhaliensis]|uniref:Uncharacterized protein n=1 Tax=Nonomuraea maheshkhaliensis TaxID=419590 RepID=A0ABN2FMI4_9ACTN
MSADAATVSAGVAEGEAACRAAPTLGADPAAGPHPGEPRLDPSSPAPTLPCPRHARTDVRRPLWRDLSAYLGWMPDFRRPLAAGGWRNA